MMGSKYRKSLKKAKSAHSKPVVQQPHESRRVTPRTQNQLYSLVHGNAELAERLIKNSRLRYPDRTEQWLWEKVIYDLERDHGYR